MIGDAHALTEGYVARHRPPESKVGKDVVLLDLALDFLLAHLHEQGVMGDLVTFKGGTALRKLFAGPEGRFSTDLDLAAVEPGVDRSELAELIAGHCDVALGPFQFAPAATRGRWHIGVSSAFGDPGINIKLDVGPPCWLAPETRSFVEHPTHARYGFDLPPLACMRLEEVLAEKVARLCRIAAARDAWDLVWAAGTSPHSRFSSGLVRRVSVLKVWVDNNGLRPAWSRALAPRPFDPERWLSRDKEWDDEQIGLLTRPPPSLVELEADLVRLYGWLGALSEEDKRWARADPRDRGEVIRELQGLENSVVADMEVW